MSINFSNKKKQKKTSRYDFFFQRGNNEDPQNGRQIGSDGAKFPFFGFLFF